MEGPADVFAGMREHLIEEIVEEATATASRTGRASFSAAVLDALRQVPRHEFVPVEIQAFAYLNRPLPIGCGKTVSQPFIVALMTDVLEVEPEHTVLEIGTGAGYQAAVLARLAAHVDSVDIIEELANDARERLKRLGCRNVDVHVGNGYRGWPAHAPYDRIIVTAACELIPPRLLAQLNDGGRMIVPTGLPDQQALTLVEKSATGRITTRDLLPVRFSLIEEPDDFAGAA